MSVIIGPIRPLPSKPMLYALDAEESSMQEPEEELSKEGQAIDEAYIRENSIFAFSMLPSTKPEDFLILDEVYEHQPELLAWFRSVYDKLNVHMTDQVQYATPKHFKRKVVRILADHSELDVVSTVCYSYNSQDLFPDNTHLLASRHVNAKTALGELSEKYHFSIPKTVLTSVAEAPARFKQEFSNQGQSVYAKVDGLGGGSNVSFVASADIMAGALQNYAPDQACILQEAIGDTYFETIHVYSIANDSIQYDSSRAKMTKDKQWYGNIFDPKIVLTEHQRAMLDAAAYAVQQEGYAAEEPLLVGFDAFMDDTTILITECNARWLGSTPSEYALRRLGIYDSVTATSTIDEVTEDELAAYMSWVEANLFEPGSELERPFALLPLGFSGYVVQGKRAVGLIVIGDLRACHADIRQKFSSGSFGLMDNSVAMYGHVTSKLQ